MLPHFMQKQSSGHTDASLCISTTAASASACLEGVVGLSSAFELCFLNTEEGLCREWRVQQGSRKPAVRIQSMVKMQTSLFG